MYASQRGFIALIFVLGISMTLMTWIGLSSAQFFTYIHTKKDFLLVRDEVRDLIACADAVVDREVRLYLYSTVIEYQMYRNLYFQDPIRCFVFDRSVEVLDIHESRLRFGVSLDIDRSVYLNVNTLIRDGFVQRIQTEYHW